MVLKVVFVIFLALLAASTLAAPSNFKQAENSNGKGTRTPKDYFEDEIRYILQMSVKELLEYTFDTFSQLNTLSLNGFAEMDKLLTQASPEVRNDLELLKNNTERQLLDGVGEVIVDLAKVLPSLSEWSKDQVIFVDKDGDILSAGDIIWALLQLTLKAFVQLIADTLETSDIILVRVMIEFEDLATKARPEVGNALIKISDEYLEPARRVILPVLHDLQKVLGSKKQSKEAFKPGNPRQSIRQI